MAVTRVTKHPWPYRSTTPGTSDSFDIVGLQDVLRQYDEHLTWVGGSAPDLPREGDRWADTATGLLKLYYAATWRVLGAAVPTVQARPPTDADFASAPADGTLALDSASERLYCRVNGFWKSTPLA